MEIPCGLQATEIDANRDQALLLLMKKIAAGAFGFVLGLLLFAVGREIAFDTRSWPQLFSDGLSSVGKLGWVDTTLVTGIAAVGAAIFSIRAVKKQIEASDRAVQRQIDQAALIESGKKDARHTAIRATIPLTLSDLMDYCTEVMVQLSSAHRRCVGYSFPRDAPMPSFSPAPIPVINDLKELIEFSKPEDRKFIWQILVSLQILRSRLDGLAKSHASSSSIVTKSNIEAYIVNASDLMARLISYFEYARGFADTPPNGITRAEVGTALTVALLPAPPMHIIDDYALNTDAPWDPWTR